MRAEPGISLWDTSAAEVATTGALRAGDVDVAIVGGGFTGLSTALHAAEAGLSCQVIEARQIGYGGSGRNVGLVNAGLWLPPQEVRTRLGEKRGSALIDLLGRGPDDVFALIERHGIRCEPHRCGTIHAAHAPRGVADLERRALAWQRLGAPVELLSREATATATGTNAYHAGLLDRRAGTINPMGYARGLARAAIAAGATVATGVTATGLRRHGARWIVDTDHGPVDAGAVVLGTTAYTDALWPGLRRSFTTIAYFQLATEPLGSRAEVILPGRHGLWDTGRVMFSLRKDDFGRLVVGSMGRVVGGARGLSHRWAARRLRHLFPALGPVRFETAWHGQIDMTPDHLPRLHRLAENVYAVIGYNGRGIAPGTVFGRVLAQALARGSDADLPLALTDPKPIRSGPLMTRLYDLAFTANQMLKAI